MGISTTLHKLGLNEHEAALYMAGIAIGPSLASQLAKESGVERVMTYHSLKGLQTKGLLSTSGSAKKTVFTMEPPSALTEQLRRRMQELQDLESEVEQVAAELESQRVAGDDHIRVRFYEGIEGAKNVSEQMLKAKGSHMRVLAPIKNIMDMLPRKYVSWWLREVDKAGITSSSIWSVENRHEDFNRQGRDLRLQPEDMEYESMMITYEDKAVFITSGRRPTTIVIENQEVVDTLNALHKQAWKNSREV